MIKNVVFDMGNVLINYAPEEFIQSFTTNTEHQKLLLDEIFYADLWQQFDRGTLTKEELVEKASENLPDELHPSVRDILETWYEKMTPITEMKDILKRLKANGYDLYLFSNVSQDFHKFKQIIPGLGYFDGLFLSSDWKGLKPEIELYQNFFIHFDLDPSECFFVDDLRVNIEGASALGMQGHVFDGNIDDLKNHFMQVGIVI
ncbi:putative hydrolase of the HAD superfamily [Alkalibacterium putridalgicola]|uniref:Haloacid dehalogenase n=1 Tax=Alkalibacterium putridalgicola TaxID=426703 RepID=A0A1H7S1P5_9LACT|nr:HAD family phosphatase [Alkalibacterium putridalgicola]GEK88361.1 haloacid dehalogenase [Alkalibacterium putridalgicola]SEL66209.1 putative hydrolase of the HAD superfamily [Alkalibacterium putridalgicola]